MLSIPVWIAELLYDIHNVAVLPMYIWTVLSWAALGFVADSIISRQRNQRRAHG
jgi:hypothetical protein